MCSRYKKLFLRIHFEYFNYRAARSFLFYTSTVSPPTSWAETVRWRTFPWIIRPAGKMANIFVEDGKYFLCSKQHAALQYRLVPYTRLDGSQGKRVQLYVMDLNSANGTFVNNNKIESQKYVQLLEKVNSNFCSMNRTST